MYFLFDIIFVFKVIFAINFMNTSSSLPCFFKPCINIIVSNKHSLIKASHWITFSFFPSKNYYPQIQVKFHMNVIFPFNHSTCMIINEYDIKFCVQNELSIRSMHSNPLINTSHYLNFYFFPIITLIFLRNFPIQLFNLF